MKPHKIFNNLLVYLSFWSVFPEPDGLTLFCQLSASAYSMYSQILSLCGICLTEFVNNNFMALKKNIYNVDKISFSVR